MVYFLGYVILAQSIKIKVKQIKANKNWPKLKLIRNIQIFLSFINLYQCFIQDFSKIAALFTITFKIMELDDVLALILIRVNINKVVDSGLELILFKFKKTNLIKSTVLANFKIYINVKGIRFLISKARITFF